MGDGSSQVFVGLGSNLGDREANLRAALDALDEDERTRLIRCSHFYETEPIGPIEQPAFLNAAAEVETEHAPLEFLGVLKAIERRVGRTPGERWGPRVIDIDIILWDSRIIDVDGLKAPHPRFRERAFVLAPLSEIAGGVVDPVTGQTVAELAIGPQAEGRVRKID